MKIAFVTGGTLPVPAIKGGAVEVLTQYLIDGFIDNGDSVDIYTIADDGLNRIEKNDRLRVFQFRYSKFHFFILRCANYFFKLLKKDIVIFPYDLKIRKKIIEEEYDYVIVENNLYVYRNIYTSYRKRFKNTKFIYHIHNTLSDNRSIQAYKFIAETADKIISVSDFLKNDCLKYKKTDNIEVVHNCVDLELFKTGYNVKELKKKLCISEGDFVFSFSGRLTDDKGVIELLRAFNRLTELHENVKLLMMGSKKFGTNEKDEYVSGIEEELKNPKIIFTGFINHNEIHQYIECSNCVVIPSKWEEPFGVVALEAMAMAKPIISSNSGGLMEVVDESCARIIDKNLRLEENLYEAMVDMYNNKNKSIIMGCEGYNKIHKIIGFNKKFYFKLFCDNVKIRKIK